MKPYWMGLDIGGTKCAVLLATVDGGIHLKDKLRFETQSERGFEPVYAQLTETMDEILRRPERRGRELRRAAGFPPGRGAVPT